MKPTKKKINELAGALGWILIEPQKNPYMISFKLEESDEIRINIYFTTMTVTVQSRASFGSCKTFKEVDLNLLEQIFTNNK